MALGKSQLLALKDYIRGYKVYSVNITQTGVLAPTVNNLHENTIGTVAWTYNGVGAYELASSSLFKTNKIELLFGKSDINCSYFVGGGYNTTSVIRITTRNSAGGVANAQINNLFLEVRLYN